MSDPLVSLANLQTYLGMTSDTTLMGEIVVEASRMVERDTGRVFSLSSNVSRTYSTDGQAAITIHDRPLTDATRVVTLAGATLSEVTGSESVWFLPDWRTPTITTTVQFRHFDYSRGDWYKSDPNWFDKNLDRRPYQLGTPNDLVITGVEGYATVPSDVFHHTRALAALLYWQAKAGASGFVQTPQGQEIDVTADRPEGYARFVREWTLRTAVAAV